MTRPARSVAFLCTFALAFALSGCGGGSGGLSAAAQSRLVPLVEQVRRDAESGDRVGTQRALAELRNAVASFQSHGDISSARAAQILDAAAGVESRLAMIPTTTTTPTPTTQGGGHGHGGKGGGDKKGGGDGNG